MATIEARTQRDGKTSFRAKIRMKGARAVSASFPRLTDARKWAKNAEVDIEKGRYFKDAVAKQHTLAEAIDRYTREVAPRKPRTAPYQARQLAWWSKELGHLSLADLSASAISTARARLMATAGANERKRGPATANRYLAALSHVLTIAGREWEWLEDNAARRLGKLREAPGRERFLSEEECGRLLAACRQSPNADLYPVVLLAVSTGMRRSEILHLRYQWIDLANEMVYLYETKNGERRGVPLRGAALATLRERIEGVDNPEPDRLIFAGKTGRTPFDLRKPWYAAIADAGLKGFRFHDLRHTAALFLAKGGVSLAEIGAVLGHKSVAMTKRYSHFARSHLGEVVAEMNRRVLGDAGREVTQ